MDCLKGFPAKEIVFKWLKAGYVDNNSFSKTDSGTPQDGIISHLLANIALDGMKEELGVKYHLHRENHKLARSSCLKSWVYLNFMILSAILVSGNHLYIALYREKTFL